MISAPVRIGIDARKNMGASRCLVAFAALLLHVAAAGPVRQAPPSPPMPTSEWRQATDPSSGRVYYWHVKTRQTTWIRPAELDAPPAAQSIPDAAASDGVAQTALADEAVESALAEKPKVMPLHARVGKAAKGARSRLASAVRFGSDELDATASPAKSLMKGVYLSSIFVVAAAVL